MSNSVVFPSTAPRFLHEDLENKRVYQYSEFYKRDILLYDFNVKIGDKMPTDSLRLSLDTLFTLEDISTITNMGYKRKVYTFVNGADSIVWIEGIGNSTDFALPYALKHDQIMKLICVHKGNETVYDVGSFMGYTCEMVNAIYDENQHENISTVEADIPTTVKILRDGHIYILRGDKTYTLQGAEVH